MEIWRKSFIDRNIVFKILILNLIVYAAILFWEAINGMPLTKNGIEAQLREDQIYHPISWLALQGNFAAFISKPWSILTFMFTHERFMAILSSMIWLLFFGTILQQLLGNKRVIPLYIYGGFFGGIIYVLVSTFMSANYYLASASLSVFAIAAAVTTVSPNYKVFTSFNGGFSIWILSAVYALLTLFTSSVPVIAAHLIAGITGFFFIRQLNQGRDLGKWMNDLGNKMNTMFEPDAKSTKRNNPYFTNDEQKLNKILDKINERGIQSLNKEEKLFLDNQSK